MYDVPLTSAQGKVLASTKTAVYIETKRVYTRAGSRRKFYSSGQNQVLRKKLGRVSGQVLTTVANSQFYCDILLDYTIHTD